MSADSDERHEPYDPHHAPQVDVVAAELATEPTVFLDSSQRMRTFWRFLIFGAGVIFVHVAVGTAVTVGLVFYLVVSEGVEVLAVRIDNRDGSASVGSPVEVDLS